MVFDYYISRYNCLRQYVRVWDNGDFKNLDIKKLIKNDGRIKSRKKYLKYIIGKDEENFITQISKKENKSELYSLIKDTHNSHLGVDSRSWLEYTLRLIKYSNKIKTSNKLLLEEIIITHLDRMVDSKVPKHYDVLLCLRKTPLYYINPLKGASVICAFRLGVSIQLAIMIVASKKCIPSRKEKLKDHTIKLVTIIKKIKAEYAYFNVRSKSSIESVLSVFYNPEYKLEKHPKYKLAYNNFNTLSLEGVNELHKYIQLGYNYEVDLEYF